MKRSSYFFDNDREDRLNLNPYTYHKPIIKTSGNETWISFKGKINFTMFYKVVHFWLMENGYVDIDGEKDKIETFYYEKAGENGAKPEMWVWWRAHKPAPLRNKMFTHRFEIEFQILGMKNDTFVVDGQKFKANYGEVNIFIRPYLDMEFKKKAWKENPFTKFISKWWEFRAYLEQVNLHEDNLYEDFCKLHATIKQFLGLNTFYVYKAPMFHPPGGFPQYKL